MTINYDSSKAVDEPLSCYAIYQLSISAHLVDYPDVSGEVPFASVLAHSDGTETHEEMQQELIEE